MAGHIEFELNGTKIRYFKDQNVLFLKPGKNVKKDQLSLIKNKLETLLSVDSIKVDNSGISIKLSDAPGLSNAPELLRSMGATGGEEVEDASSVATQPEEDKVKEDEREKGPPMGMQPVGALPPTAGVAPLPGQEQDQLNAGLGYGKVFTLIYESTFGPNASFSKPKKPGRRTGKYWEPVEAITGKNRAKIKEDDILSKRREYARKPANEKRDKVLRSLDRAFNYFFRRLDETLGKRAAEKYAEDYYAVDDLDPKDYSLKGGTPEQIGVGETNTPVSEFELSKDELNGPSFKDFADILKKKESSYDDIEITDEPFQ